MFFYIYFLNILFLNNLINCDKKVWKYTSNISDPLNWERNPPEQPCKGLKFATYNFDDIPVEKLTIKKLILPILGRLTLSDKTKITFDESGLDVMNCVKLKRIQKRDWLDISGWYNLNSPNNTAIPYYERLPTRYDEIVFPSYLHARSLWTANREFEVKKISFNDLNINNNNNDLEDKYSFIGPDIKSLDNEHIFFKSAGATFNTENARISINSQNCTDLSGCEHILDETYSYSLCFYAKSIFEIVTCKNPIKPEGFCNQEKCGASILINDLKHGFVLDNIKKLLKKYSNSNTYAHKIYHDGHAKIQIIFNEEKFTGSSLIDAKDFYDTISYDDYYCSGNVTMNMSGVPLTFWSQQFKHIFISICETFLIIAGMFIGLFSYFSSQGRNFRNRLFRSQPLSTYLLRYNTVEDRIIDDNNSQSVASGSTFNIHRSFENPSYNNYDDNISVNTSHESLVSLSKEITHRSIEEVDEKPLPLKSDEKAIKEKNFEDINLNEIDKI